MSKDNSAKDGSTAALVLGIIAVVFAFMPIVNNFIALPLGLIGLIIAIVAMVKKHRGGTAIAGLVLAVLAIALTFMMNTAIYGATKVVDHAVKTENAKQEKQTSKWSKSIYDSITSATVDFSTGSAVYNGGTQYSGIEAQVGAPTSTSSSDNGFGGQTVTASWSSVTLNSNSKVVSITLSYDQNSGQIISKSETGL